MGFKALVVLFIIAIHYNVSNFNIISPVTYILGNCITGHFTTSNCHYESPPEVILCNLVVLNVDFVRETRNDDSLLIHRTDHLTRNKLLLLFDNNTSLKQRE